MFRDMILKASNSWYNSKDCPISEMISYISIKGALRDAQIEAVKVYLFLKIACNNKPLAQLFKEGYFNSLDLDEQEIKSSTRDFLKSNPGAAALYEYCINMSSSPDIKTNVEKILTQLKSNPTSIDYSRVFEDIFYNVSYSDYIFSLPMGAGKTFLMAAFIYLDLYFSALDPDNKAFAQNFIVLAPSGLKSSIIPSLKTIRNFNPSWILPDDIAESLRKEVIFEALESNSSASKSNQAKNPNARKVNNYLRRQMRGVVFVTNAEKVILDKFRLNPTIVQRTLDDDSNIDISNELRALIGQIPHLSIYIDEVHHASDDSIKLRQVVSQWAERDSVVSVIGFSGTPYLQKAEKIPIVDRVNFSSTEINNVVYYYPLVDGLGNFLKTPLVIQYENRENYLEIVGNGLKDFFANCKDLSYKDGTCSKVAIYCNSIEELENEVYPVASKVISEMGLNPNESILKYHEDHKEFKLSPDARMEFATLDSSQSKIRIVLLVQIGKEGWDCKSLTGVILAKDNKSTRNMVLQTCCRCLRQVVKYDFSERAYIYLCRSNGLILEEQLKAEQHITLKEFQEARKKTTKVIDLYNRKHDVNLPPIDFYQLEVEYNAVVVDDVDPDANLKAIPLEDLRIIHQKITKDFQNRILDRSLEDVEFGEVNLNLATFSSWIGTIAKESFGFVTIDQLYEHEPELRKIYDTITFESNGLHFYSSKFDHKSINSMIRQAFYAKRHIKVTSEYIERSRELLLVFNFVKKKEVYDPEMYYPNQDVVHNLMEKGSFDVETMSLFKRTYHYIPYHLDSSFEIKILKHLHELSTIKGSDLEVYYNGDRFLTDFHIKCYESVGSRWKYLGQYTPDFLIIRRRDNQIYQALIIETKGAIYSQDQTFIKKKSFVEEYFLGENEKQYGYKKFDYLYIEDSMSEGEQFSLLEKTIRKFFGVDQYGN